MANKEDTLVQQSKRLDILQSSVKQLLRNHIKTKREFKTFYKKDIGVLLEITSGNIKKKKLNLKESVKGNKQTI